MKASDVLRSEHDVILDVLIALESIAQPSALAGGLDLLSAREALDFLSCFADRCHHGKEERLFFEALARRGLPRAVGPLAVMLTEHDEGRMLLVRMGDALADAHAGEPGAAARFASAATAYVALMRAHIDKENGVLFPMGDGMLSEAEQSVLLGEFEHFEHAEMEAGAHGRFLDLAGALCTRLGVVHAPRAAVSAHACCGHDTRCK